MRRNEWNALNQECEMAPSGEEKNTKQEQIIEIIIILPNKQIWTRRRYLTAVRFVMLLLPLLAPYIHDSHTHFGMHRRRRRILHNSLHRHFRTCLLENEPNSNEKNKENCQKGEKKLNIVLLDITASYIECAQNACVYAFKHWIPLNYTRQCVCAGYSKIQTQAWIHVAGRRIYVKNLRNSLHNRSHHIRAKETTSRKLRIPYVLVRWFTLEELQRDICLRTNTRNNIGIELWAHTWWNIKTYVPNG